MFDQFPKQRPALPPEYAAIYEEHYKENRQGQSNASSVAQKVEGWMHRKVAEDTVCNIEPSVTLEIGAGTLNQLPYENLTEGSVYDIVEPFTYLFESSPYLSKVRNVYADIKDIASDRTPAMSYDRITSVATFEHICNLPEVVARSGLLLKKHGKLRIAIPSEGTILWTLGWKLTTGLEFRLRRRLDYSVLMRHEHVNSAEEIEEVLRYFFASVDCQVFGLSKKLSLYQFYVCSTPIIDRCSDHIKLVDVMKYRNIKQ
jgi:hypothetical protein